MTTIKRTAIGRPVRVTAIGFAPGKSVEEVVAVVDREAAKGTDIVALPECWRGEQLDTLDGEVVQRMAALARKHRTHLVCPIYRRSGRRRLNSAILLDRRGRRVMVYDKIYPFWGEMNSMAVAPAARVAVCAADFGRVGLATCFDVNFPAVWQRLAEKGAELVIWPSAYSAGRALQAHAINHHYYIVSSTWARDCHVYDITGDLIRHEQSADINVTAVTLDLDRCIFHGDFHAEKRAKLLAEQADRIELEQDLPREFWFVLRAKKPGVSARALARRYGLEELSPYIQRSRRAIDALRGRPIV